MTYEEIVAAYICDWRGAARDELEHFRRANSLREAILRATEKRPHQYRIPQVLLEKAKQQLLSSSSILRAAPDFERLYSAVEKLIGSERGIGELCVYDIAHRIGAFLGFEPKLVYLHRGTRAGARALGFTGKTLDPRTLPAAFSRLTPAEIEDCLCIYKAAVTAIRNPYDLNRCRPMNARCSYKSKARKC